MFKRLRAILPESKKVTHVFDENALTDAQWVAWKIRCAKHMEIEITDSFDVILASRHKSITIEQENGSNKELR